MQKKQIYGEACISYEKLKQISAEQETDFLKKGVLFTQLDKIAYFQSDNEFAKVMREQEYKLFAKISKMKG